MCQVGKEEWGMNMVGACQTDRTGAGALGKVAVKAKKIVILCLNHSSIKGTVL
jgi:hypothetical protein